MRIPTSDDPVPERRRARSRLRQVEIIEGLLEFDLASLELYADAVAEEAAKSYETIFADRVRLLSGPSHVILA